MENGEKKFTRFGSLDYIEKQVDVIFSDLKDCLTGRVKRPDILCLKSERHSFECAQTLLTDRLSIYGINVRYCNGEDTPFEDNVYIYDLDNARWIKH